MRHIRIGGREFGIHYNAFKLTHEFGELIPIHSLLEDGATIVQYKFNILGTDDSMEECEKRIYEEFGGQDYEND